MVSQNVIEGKRLKIGIFKRSLVVIGRRALLCHQVETKKSNENCLLNDLSKRQKGNCRDRMPPDGLPWSLARMLLSLEVANQTPHPSKALAELIAGNQKRPSCFIPKVAGELRSSKSSSQKPPSQPTTPPWPSQNASSPPRGQRSERACRAHSSRNG